MKQILSLALLCLACSFSSKAQSVTNDTDCDVIITQVCYSSSGCVKTYGIATTVNRRSTTPLPPACGATMTYEVCWMGAPCTPVCVEVNASNPPSPCTSATWSETIGTCIDCAPPFGMATATYNPFGGNVLIN